MAMLARNAALRIILSATISTRYAMAVITRWAICKPFAARATKPSTGVGRTMNTPGSPKNQDQEEVRSTIMQLSTLTDLIGLRTYIIKQTDYGKVRGPEPWEHTRAAMTKYAPSIDVDEVIRLFRSVGCDNEIEAVRWLLKHDDLVP
jgi:hypothetical protein